MAPDGSERLTNRQSDRSTSTSRSPERVAQVRTHRTAPLDQSVADPSSLPASRPRDRVNQRTPCASTGEFFNTIGAKRPFISASRPIRSETGKGRCTPEGNRKPLRRSAYLHSRRSRPLLLLAKVF